MSYLDFHKFSRRTKRAIFFGVDCVLIPLSLYFAFALRYGTATPFEHLTDSWVLFPVLTVVGGGIAFLLQLDRMKLNAFDITGISRIGLVAVAIAAGAIVISYLLGMRGPRSVPVIFGIIFFFLAVTARLSGLALLRWLADRDSDYARVAIYGAGAAGIQLASALRQASEARPMVFVDDNISLHGLVISGLRVHSPDQLPDQLRKYGITQVLLAVPSMSKQRRAEILAELKTLPAEVKVLPSYVELMAGNGLGEGLRPVSPDQLLGRDKVALDVPEIAKTYAGRVVMVTGAGGSIGSELCRQLLNCGPRKIVLFEQGEYQLYAIDQELRVEARNLGIDITARLGSVIDKARVKAVMADQGVEIILHAAAYKHVPLVEENELEGARNNVLGTQVVAMAAAEAGIERFILVSTDKAVRPTNVMGATKRLAELVVQDIQTRHVRTKFAMVRFGNVLGSSGSVLPLFQQQIAKGGPITVTHREVTRFFMTIPEAARLVLLAGAYAGGGEVFVLDMGKPQKIVDIARQMVALSGRTVLDPETGQGDIAIEFTGLRPGEKLYEELLIDDAGLLPTPHPKILCAQEKSLSQIEVAAMMRELHDAIASGDAGRLRGVIVKCVEGYRRPVADTA